MDLVKIVFASIIFMVWSVLIGFFVADLAPYSAIIAALAAGIYVGHKADTHKGMVSGFLAGLIGGIMGGFISIYIPNIGGVPISFSVASFLTPVIGFTGSLVPWLSFAPLALIGITFGTLGGAMGSVKKLRGIFLFLTMFLLFIILGAVDNAAWNILKPGWTWNMSFSHVLTNEIDLFVAAIFAFFVTILTYLMNLHK